MGAGLEADNIDDMRVRFKSTVDHEMRRDRVTKLRNRMFEWTQRWSEVL